MTVAELMKALSAMDPNTTVVAVGEGGQLLPLSGTVTLEMVFEEERTVIDEPEVVGLSLTHSCNRPGTMV
jgi:hypothetical protein